MGLALDQILSATGDWGGAVTIVVGLVFVAGGIAIMTWATAAAGDVDLANPSELVTDGPYAWSRHPMYVAWTLGYLGIAAVLSSTWMLILTPILALWMHVEAGREERRMLRTFGSLYADYRHRVRRYV